MLKQFVYPFLPVEFSVVHRGKRTSLEVDEIDKYGREGELYEHSCFVDKSGQAIRPLP